MKVKFINKVSNTSKEVEFNPKEIAEKYIEENKNDLTAVINDLSFGGFYGEDLTAYIENLLDKIIENGLGIHTTYYTYDYDDYVNLRAAIKDCILH